MTLAIALLISLPLAMLLFWVWPKPGPPLPPGPRRLPITGNLHMLGHLPHRALAKLAQKYGPIMSLRLGHVPTIVVSSPKAAELFLKQHDAVFASRPITQASIYLGYRTKGMAFTQYGEYWRRVRKVCTLHLLTLAKVASFEDLRRAEIGVAVQRLAESSVAHEAVDVGERVGKLIEGIVFKMVVGEGKEEDKGYDLTGVVEESMTLAGAFNLADFVPYLAPLDLQVCVLHLNLKLH